jgi:cell division protein FtsN
MKKQRGSFVTGMVVGLLIGLGVALGIALYITKTPVPFINKLPQRGAEQDAAEAEHNKHWDPNAALAGKNPARPDAKAQDSPVTEANPASPPAASASRVPRDPASILAAQPDASPATRPADGPQASFYVQAGAYARTEDAEGQRARLAMMGLTARVTEREQSGRTIYRVRLGPFDSREAAEDKQGQLAGAGVEANLVRVER